MSKIRVMVVDDHPVVREGLKKLLEVDHSIEVIAQASSGWECLNLLAQNIPDIIFMDIKMPGISGIETTRLVCNRYPQVKVIMLTIYDEDQYLTEAIEAGARGYVLKNADRDNLIKVARTVIENEPFIDPSVSKVVINQLKKDAAKPIIRKPILSQRELEVLKWIVEGQSDHEIAQSLFISENTVRSHVKSILRKFGVSSRTKAVAKAMKDKIIQGQG